ncbi:carbohydrate ABC transporter permease [Neobacillus sp. YIM B02564]|uniref:Carbohydrate ABC transporter permease n=1 Tax=Neobacillus paridis TaxID=2803862 RepID=A0ABS1TTK0_9BACI|nr:carbohydrate ABC transporter permease [Neobacillus paridis]MBL4954637.1 carbohydrate ABC transporter permease [Neobacillus paridis]
MVVPFLWMILTSLKTYGESIHVPPVLIPKDLQWGNYKEVFDLLPFFKFMLNTFIVTVARTVGQLFLCSLAAYAFARIEFPGRNFLFLLALSVLMVPGQVFLLPQYMIMVKLGWLNTLQAVIVPGLFSAFGTFLLRQFFMGLPKELEEAARLDGCNHFQIYWRIMLPLAQPGLIALGIFTALWSWNELMWPMIVNSSPDKMTLSVGLASLQGQYLTNYPILMAGSFLAILPMLILFIILQKQFIEGIALTGGK